MYKSSSSGWTEVSLGRKLSFENGSTEFVAGETVSQGSTVAVVRIVIVTSGTWSGGNAAGYFTITNLSGGNFSAGAITGSILGTADAASADEENVFLPGGKFKFNNTNFGGHVSTFKMYGADGVNKGFEFDGDYFIFISTGMENDAPVHVTSFRKHLFYSFTGGSVQHSAPGEPYIWSVVTGAAEIGVGDEITGFLQKPDSLVIFARNLTNILYGTGIADWDLKLFDDGVGAIEGTIQDIGSGTYLDDRGLMDLNTTLNYGDFKSSILSRNIDPWLKTMLENAQVSMRVKEKNQYRLFFNDKQGLTLTLHNGKVIGFTRQDYDVQPVCTSTQ